MGTLDGFSSNFPIDTSQAGPWISHVNRLLLHLTRIQSRFRHARHPSERRDRLSEVFQQVLCILQAHAETDQARCYAQGHLAVV